MKVYKSGKKKTSREYTKRRIIIKKNISNNNNNNTSVCVHWEPFTWEAQSSQPLFCCSMFSRCCCWFYRMFRRTCSPYVCILLYMRDTPHHPTPVLIWPNFPCTQQIMSIAYVYLCWSPFFLSLFVMVAVASRKATKKMHTSFFGPRCCRLCANIAVQIHWTHENEWPIDTWSDENMIDWFLLKM